MAQSDRSSRGAADELNPGQPGNRTTEPRGPGSKNPTDNRLDMSPLSPNALDQTDESQKAADITHAGEGMTREPQKGTDCAGESPQSPAPCAPDGRSADRYAG